jgi:hypothetical protein
MAVSFPGKHGPAPSPLDRAEVIATFSWQFTALVTRRAAAGEGRAERLS